MPLSASTRGLKFMNRAQGGGPAPFAAPAPAPSAPIPSAGTGAKGVEPPKVSGSRRTGAGQAVAMKEEQVVDEVKKGFEEGWAGRRVAGSSGRPAIIQESSLLSFPLLSPLSTKESAITTTFTGTTATYSSMPLTSSTVSGRRSYGGANVEIEKLNDPSSHQPTADSPSSSSASKPRRPKADRAAAIVPVRRSGSSSVLSSSKAGKRTAALDEGEGGKKRRKTEDEEELRAGAGGGLRCDNGGDGEATAVKGLNAQGGFARPAGFEGVRKNAAAKGKGKGRAREGDLMDAEGSFKWAKRGEVREWDEGKGNTSDENDAELLEMSGEDSMDDDEEDDASEVEEMLLQASKQDEVRQPKTRQERDKRRQEVERAVEREEGRLQFGGAGGGSKKGKARR
ncbi:hypothetical protein Rt10032_c10g4206 [Rhodotorula toruloides]|uniref:Uncharacterized protein n=1 Tax=Rhodotorula toruloides TaxID=5286 RepID=A0A511KIH8_RHOTO|nr:hypothetical protein Rt10032_c10g4206 [Rhodotorula toruloides]